MHCGFKWTEWVLIFLFAYKWSCTQFYVTFFTTWFLYCNSLKIKPLLCSPLAIIKVLFGPEFRNNILVYFRNNVRVETLSNLCSILKVVSLPQDSPPTPVHTSPPHTFYMRRPYHFSRFDQLKYIWLAVQIIKPLII